MRDVGRWLVTATRSLAVDLFGRERQRAARSRFLALLLDLFVAGCVLFVAVGIVVVAGLAVGVTVVHGASVPVVVAAWAFLFLQLMLVPLVALRVGSAVYTRFA
ncbi:hypothetical protein BRC89_12320 [Halobacteriales archaeon QS_4_70_19]|nr:MAG: hypothetical protein BRC89_12320 [Halobacteriales archaeon QS_4_70_19]